MSIKDHNLPMLNFRSDWSDWINSIEDLAVRNDVWTYCDPEGIENLIFTVTKPPDSAHKDTIQKYHSLQAIYDSEKKKYDKVSERIDITVCQEFKQHYLGIHTVRGKLIALAESIQPTAKDQKQNVRTEFEKLKKGVGNTGLDKWLSRWPALVNNAKRYKIENLSEAQICDAFIEASRDINPPFYNYMKSKEAQVENETTLIRETARTMEKISDAFLAALNEINPNHASIGSLTIDNSDVSDSDQTDNDIDITIMQKVQNTINKTLRSFRRLKPTLSDRKITIGFCIKQFRTMAPPSEKTARGRAAHATLQGRKHGHDSGSSDDEEFQPKKKRQGAEGSFPTPLRDCVCGLAHKYMDCRYLNPKSAPSGWNPIVQIQSKVITAIKGSKRLRTKIEKNFLRNKIALPNFWPADASANQPERATEDNVASTQTSATARSRASFATSRFAFSTAAIDEFNDYFRLDNCADTHVCNDLTRFTQYKPLYEELIRFGDTDTHIEGTGNVTVHIDTLSGPSVIELENVAYVPGFHWNLINMDSLEKQGLFFNTRTCWMEYSDGSKAFKATKHGAFRVVEPHINHAVFKAESHMKAAQAFAMAKKSRTPQIAVASMDVWHARLGHIRKEVLEQVPQAVKGVALGTRDFERFSDLCPECQLGQAHRQISRIPTWRGTYPFEKIHLDLIQMEEAFNLDAWVVHFYCDYSAYHVSFNLPNKTQEELVSVTQEFFAITNNNWGFITRYIQSDGEKGLGQKWRDLITTKGITFNPSPPDTPDQNGLAERSGGVIMTIARKLRIQSKLPHKLWPYIVAHATRLLNRIPVQRKQWQTPFQTVHGRKPNLSYLKIIGSLAYVLIKNKKDRPARAKLQEKALKGWLVGLDATNIYRVWIPQLHRVVRSRDVQVDEKVLYDPQLATNLPETGQTLLTAVNEIDLDESDGELPPIMDDTTALNRDLVQYEVPPEMPTPMQVSSEQIIPRIPQNPTESERIPRNLTESDRIQQDRQQLQPYPTPVSFQSRQQSMTTQGSSRARTANTLKSHLTARQVQKQARRQAHAFRLERAKLGQQMAHAFVSARSIRTHRKDLMPPPDFWHQLKRHPERQGFRYAADAEIKSLENKKTFELVDYPENKQVLPLKWVLTYKLDDAGYLIRHKARICVRGDLQHNTTDDIYAATGAYRSFRILMALVCAFGLLCHQIDFKNAFTNADIDDEIYTTCPPGYSKPGKVWKLLKALYGLRKSPKLWFDELVSFLKGLGFNHCPDEPCILINNKTGLILFLYVDDLLVIARLECMHHIKQFKAAVNNRYGIKDLGEAISFLNIRILRDTKAKRLWICQDGYIDKICTKFGIDESWRTATTPLISSYRSQPFEGQATIQQITEMQEKVGSILYAAVVSRPDISFAASQLSQFATNPSPEHLRCANRVLSYLQTTKYYAIEFSGSVATPTEVEIGDDEVLQLSSDASFADDLETRKSTQGYLMKLFSGPIMWQSSKQKTVTTSTTEAELLSLSHTAKETIGLYRLFQQIQFDPEQQPRILCDNQQTVGLIQKETPQLTSKLKHVDIHNFWLRQVHRDGKVAVQWVPTTDMPSDGFTKPLSTEKHAHFVRQLGLVDISSRIDPGYASEEDSPHDVQISSDTE
jgi:hypothetical protein